MTSHKFDNGKKLKGIAVSSGIIIGKARLVDRSRVKILYQYLVNDQQVNREVERFNAALSITRSQLAILKDRMPEQVKEHAFILDSHLMILEDSMFTDAVIKSILDEKINAEWAVKKSLEEIRQIFEQIDDEYIRNRIDDVVNVTERILRNLLGRDQETLAEISGRPIIVAHDLSPADIAELNMTKIMGFVTDVGGRTSHTAIMAQALQIPVVVGLESATDLVDDGDILIVDGNTGEVIINPDDTIVAYYQKKQVQQKEYETSIAVTSHLPAETLDGHIVAIHANIEFLEEIATATAHGCEAIGLYRTEILYLRGKALPGEEELFNNYRKAAEAIAPNSMTIRTLDLGADKVPWSHEITRETNPALGLRAIRFCLKKPDLFKTQLRAILRASAYGKIQLMFPMISGLQEILNAKEILSVVKEDLDNRNIDYDHELRVGIMIEIPSAVSMAEILAQHVDFFSIGTNDLIQYSLAIDRTNEHVAYMYEPFHPAILRMIQHTVNSAKKAGISVAICGEMAGDPMCIPILLGLGLNELSMNPSTIPLIKKIIRSLSLKEARADFDNVMKLNTAKEVRSFVLNRMKTLVPELKGKGYLDA